MKVNSIFKTLIVLTGITVFSCTKDKAVVVPGKTTTPDHIDSTIVVADSIHHKVLNPYILLNPTLYTYASPSGCGNVPFPSDTIITWLMDLDSNGTNDLRFTAKNYYQMVSASNPCANYLFYTSIETLNNSDSIGTPKLELYSTYFLSLGDAVNENLNYINYESFCALGQGGGTHPVAINGGAGFYLPIKRTFGGKTNFGWVLLDTVGNNGIAIREYAINSTNGRPIKCGQTE